MHVDLACRVPDRIAEAIIARSERISTEGGEYVVRTPEGTVLTLVRDRPRYVNQWLTYPTTTY